MAETTEDEREQQTNENEQEPQTSQNEQEPQTSRDEEEPESSERDQKQEADDEQKAPDLPEPEEKSADDLLGQQVVDSHGVTIGKIEALLIHSEDERASWARVKTGLLGRSSAFLPLHDAQQDGGQIRVVYEKAWVNEAPEIEPDGNELSDDEADALHGHYGMERVKGLTTEGADDVELSREARDAEPPTMKEPPWSIEKYPLPDMERPEGKEPEGKEPEANEPKAEDSSDEGPQHEASSEQESEDEDSG